MTERYGIDISRAQGAIDWDVLAENKDLSFVLIRAAQGTAQDTYFARNIREAQRCGIDEWKRERLIRAGANVIIPDYRDIRALEDHLFPREVL